MPAEKQAAFILALPDTERMITLTGRADRQLMTADFQEYTKHDSAAAKSALALARTYAEELLTLADKLPNDPNR